MQKLISTKNNKEWNSFKKSDEWGLEINGKRVEILKLHDLLKFELNIKIKLKRF